MCSYAENTWLLWQKSTDFSFPHCFYHFIKTKAMCWSTDTSGMDKSVSGSVQCSATYFGTSLMYLSYARVFFPKLICFCLLLRTTSSVSLSAGLAESVETELKRKVRINLNRTLTPLRQVMQRHPLDPHAFRLSQQAQLSLRWLTAEKAVLTRRITTGEVCAIARVCNKQTYSWGYWG